MKKVFLLSHFRWLFKFYVFMFFFLSLFWAQLNVKDKTNP